MTVLAKYQRLETEGVWRATPDAQRRDVIVSIGDATITISAGNGTALTHWSLPAIQRLNPGERPALYQPGEGSLETLEIAEAEMIDAVEKVLKAIRKGAHARGPFRGFAAVAIAIAILGAAAIWLPQAITRYTASLVPKVARHSIGEQVLDQMERVAGAPCQAPSGLRALDKLEARLFTETPTDLVVYGSTLKETAHLPGDVILISHTLVEDFETPDVLAGFVLAEDQRRQGADPLARLLDFAGLRAALGLLLQGKVSPEALRRMAEGVVATAPSPIDQNALITRMASAQVPSKGYAYAIDFSGESTANLIQTSASEAVPVLEDGDWIALQRICED